MTLSAIFRLPLPAGLALLEARSCRLSPDAARISYLDRCIYNARAACRERILQHYTLTPTT